MSTETQSPQDAAALAAFVNTTRPVSEVRTGSAFEKGQFDWAVTSLTPGFDKNGLATVTISATCTAPSEIAVLPNKGNVFTRTLYFGSHKDPKCELPESNANNPGIRFLKKILLANNLPTNDQSIAQIIAALTGKTFGCALVAGKDYEVTNADGSKTKKEGGLEFGNTVTPAGVIPAKLERVAASTTQQAPAAAPVGATFN